MMGQADPQRTLFYQLSLETFVPPEHPLRAIRPLIDDHAIRHACRELYAPIGGSERRAATAATPPTMNARRSIIRSPRPPAAAATAALRG